MEGKISLRNINSGQSDKHNTSTDECVSANDLSLEQPLIVKDSKTRGPNSIVSKFGISDRYN